MKDPSGFLIFTEFAGKGLSKSSEFRCQSDKLTVGMILIDRPQFRRVTDGPIAPTFRVFRATEIYEGLSDKVAVACKLRFLNSTETMQKPAFFHFQTKISSPQIFKTSFVGNVPKRPFLEV